MLQFVDCLVNWTGRLKLISASNGWDFASGPDPVPITLSGLSFWPGQQGWNELGTHHVDTFSQPSYPVVSSQLLRDPTGSPSACILWSMIWKSSKTNCSLNAPWIVCTRVRCFEAVSMFTIPVRMVKGPTVSSLSPLLCKTMLVKGIHLDCWGGLKKIGHLLYLGQYFFLIVSWFYCFAAECAT